MRPGRLVGIGAALAVTILAGLLAGLIATGPGPAPPPPASVPGGAPPGPPTQAPAIAIGAARYEVSGDGPAARITYMIVGDESLDENVALPWKKSTGAPWMSVTALRGPGPGSITCRITGGGRVLAEHTASGPHSQCTASEIPG